MTSILSIVLLIFWISVFGMVFGNTQINQVSNYVFYIIAPIALIAGFYEILVRKKDKNDKL